MKQKEIVKRLNNFLSACNLRKGEDAKGKWVQLYTRDLLEFIKEFDEDAVDEFVEFIRGKTK